MLCPNPSFGIFWGQDHIIRKKKILIKIRTARPPPSYRYAYQYDIEGPRERTATKTENKTRFRDEKQKGSERAYFFVFHACRFPVKFPGIVFFENPDRKAEVHDRGNTVSSFRKQTFV